MKIIQLILFLIIILIPAQVRAPNLTDAIYEKKVNCYKLGVLIEFHDWYIENKLIKEKAPPYIIEKAVKKQNKLIKFYNRYCIKV